MAGGDLDVCGGRFALFLSLSLLLSLSPWLTVARGGASVSGVQRFRPTAAANGGMWHRKVPCDGCIRQWRAMARRGAGIGFTDFFSFSKIFAKWQIEHSAKLRRVPDL